MANMTVEIRCDEQGQYSVGAEPAGEDMGMEAKEPELQPVKSLDEALQVARDLFANAPQVEQADGQAEKDFASGFKGPAASEGFA